MLDSSPIVLPAAPVQQPPAKPTRTLKRTASTASLPTPPRTRESKKRVRKVEPVHSDSDDDDDYSDGGKPVGRLLFKPTAAPQPAKPTKAKGKQPAKKQEEEDSNPFLDDEDDEEDEDEVVPVLKRAASTIGSAPASPPPSRTNQVPPKFRTPSPKRAFKTPEPSDTPLPKVGSDEESPVLAGAHPIRDSPNNLFLVDSKAAHPPAQPPSPSDFEERPTITYVFRGKKQTFKNPLYNLPPEAFEPSKLPVEHPAYSPPPLMKPRRLFSEKDAPKSRKRAATPPSPSTVPARRLRSSLR